MAKRIIVGLAAGALGIGCLWWDNFYVYLIITIALSVSATYELLFATKYIKNKLLSSFSLLFVTLTPIIYNSTLKNYYREIFLSFILILFVIMLFKHQKIRFEQLSLVAFISAAIPMSISSLISIRFDGIGEKSEHGLFMLVFTLLAAFMGDTGAYFIGTFFGKHKLAPDISPKKTVEGFFGGILFSGLLCGLFSYIYEIMLNANGEQYSVNWLMLGVIGVVCGVLGVLGDLSASLIKRECLIKDFGNIMPGHGGILDRFDSVLFVAPFLYQLFDNISSFLIQRI